jgi:hypothetical protein
MTTEIQPPIYFFDLGGLDPSLIVTIKIQLPHFKDLSFFSHQNKVD